MRTEPETELFEAFGFPVEVDQNLGHLWVIHDGTISWDQLQEIKNQAWGADAGLAQMTSRPICLAMTPPGIASPPGT
jgi:hypothetical protein